MNEYEESRRVFLTKLGLSIGTTMVASAKLSATVLNNKTEFELTEDQQQLMDKYEKWMDKFIPVIKTNQTNKNDQVAKAGIVELSEEANNWQAQLIEYMKDDNFARYYMTVTEKMTKEIY